MKRSLATLLCVLVVGCRLAEEREGLRPLPEKGNILTYQEMYGRARTQAAAALDAFLVDNWLELEQVAQVLEQTARHMPNCSDQPANIKKILGREADALRQQAVRLREAAQAKNVQTINETLQQIHLTLRGLRPGD